METEEIKEATFEEVNLQEKDVSEENENLVPAEEPTEDLTKGIDFSSPIAKLIFAGLGVGIYQGGKKVIRKIKTSRKEKQSAKEARNEFDKELMKQIIEDGLEKGLSYDEIVDNYFATKSK